MLFSETFETTVHTWVRVRFKKKYNKKQQQQQQNCHLYCETSYQECNQVNFAEFEVFTTTTAAMWNWEEGQMETKTWGL